MAEAKVLGRTKSSQGQYLLFEIGTHTCSSKHRLAFEMTIINKKKAFFKFFVQVRLFLNTLIYTIT